MLVIPVLLRNLCQGFTHMLRTSTVQETVKRESLTQVDF